MCDRGLVVVELRGPVDDMAELGPVHQVAAVKDRDAGEIGEGGVDQVIVVADAAHAGIGIESGEDRIAVVAGRQRRSEEVVASGVFEPVEGDGGGSRGGEQGGHERGQGKGLQVHGARRITGCRSGMAWNSMTGGREVDLEPAAGLKQRQQVEQAVVIAIGSGGNFHRPHLLLPASSRKGVPRRTPRIEDRM